MVHVGEDGEDQKNQKWRERCATAGIISHNPLLFRVLSCRQQFRGPGPLRAAVE